MSGAVDVVIAGAGPAGVAAAIACAGHGLEVALVDRARFPRDKPCGEGLLPQAVATLDALGLLQRVRSSAQPLDGIGFQIPGGPSACARFCDRAGEPARGLGVKRRTFDALLVDAARAIPGVTVLEGVEVRAPIFASTGSSHRAVVGLQTTAGAIRARAVVVADGLRSSLRRQLGLALPSPRNGRLGLRVHLQVPRGLPFGRYVRVIVEPQLEHYLTPVAPDELQVAVLGDAHAFAQARISPVRLVDHLRRHPLLGALLDGAEPMDKPLGAGPFRQRARAVVVDGAVLVGDAAGYVDAITGEGVGLALQTGRAAGEALATSLSAGAAMVSARALHGYVRAHREIVRDADRLTQLVLLLARFPWLARRAIGALAGQPALFERLLRVQAGASFGSVGMSSWLKLVAG